MSIFNTTINLLLDHIQTVCPDAGYCFSSSARKLSILLYADDTCLIAKNAKKCQQMLHATEVWLNWAKMKPKCRALGLQSRTARTSRFFNPKLSLCSEVIPSLNNDTILFLSMPVTSIMSTHWPPRVLVCKAARSSQPSRFLSYHYQAEDQVVQGRCLSTSDLGFQGAGTAHLLG